MEGTTVGNWKLVRRIGEGGMGVVYLAHHLSLGTTAAVKVLLSSLSHTSDVLDRFFQEARTQADLHHPHIVRVLDYVEQDGRHCLVSDYVEGGSLDQLLQESAPVSIDRALDWTGQALDALDYAHRRGVIHRDVKPSNLLLDAREQIRMTDFGIAVVLGGRRVTRTGVSLGTPHYMSPEQIRRPKEVDHRTDVYSVGLVLYELLVGRVPFESESEFDVQLAQVNQEPPRLRDLNPAIPEDLEEVVLTALAKDPDQRFSGCGALARALESVRDGGRSRPEPPPSEAEESGAALRRLRSRAESLRQWLWVVVIGFAVSALMLIVSYSRAEARRTEVSTERRDRLAAEVRVSQLEQEVEAAEQLAEEAASRAERSEARSDDLALLAEARTWPIVVADGFTSNVHDWPTGEFITDRAEQSKGLSSGSYRWTATAREGFLSSSRPGLYAPANFFAALEAKPDRCSGSCTFGLVFRFTDSGHYVFEVSGSNVLVAVLKEAEWHILHRRARSPAVKEDASIRLEIIAIGSDFRFFLDGENEASVSDDSWSAGRVGIAHGMNKAKASGGVTFDNFELRRYRPGN